MTKSLNYTKKMKNLKAEHEVQNCPININVASKKGFTSFFTFHPVTGLEICNQAVFRSPVTDTFVLS